MRQAKTPPRWRGGFATPSLTRRSSSLRVKKGFGQIAGAAKQTRVEKPVLIVTLGRARRFRMP